MPDAPAAPAAPVAPAAPAAPAPSAPAAPVTPDVPAAPDAPSLLGNGQQAASPPPPGETFVNPDGTFVPEWASKLPPEFEDARVKLGMYKNVQELAKAYRAAERMISQKGIMPLTPEATPEQIARYREAMGVPDKVEAYAETVKPKVEVPPDVQWDDSIANQYFEAAHRLNIPPDAMKELMQLNLKQREFEIKAKREAVAEKKIEGVNLLRRDWGANFDRNVAMARKAASYYGVSEHDEAFSSPAMVKAWVRMASEMAEGKFVEAGGALPAGRGDFAAQAKDIQTNKENPYYKRYQDGDPDVINMVRNLHKKAAGS